MACDVIRDFWLKLAGRELTRKELDEKFNSSNKGTAEECDHRKSYLFRKSSTSMAMPGSNSLYLSGLA